MCPTDSVTLLRITTIVKNLANQKCFLFTLFPPLTTFLPPCPETASTMKERVFARQRLLATLLSASATPFITPALKVRWLGARGVVPFWCVLVSVVSTSAPPWCPCAPGCSLVSQVRFFAAQIIDISFCNIFSRYTSFPVVASVRIRNGRLGFTLL